MISGHCATPVPARRLPRHCWPRSADTRSAISLVSAHCRAVPALPHLPRCRGVYRAAGVSPDKIARITIYIATAFVIGAAETIGLGMAFRAHEIAQLYGVPYESLRLVAALILAATAVVLIGCALRRQSFRLGYRRPRLGPLACRRESGSRGWSDLRRRYGL